MSIGVFDSGLGGLLLLRALTKKLPQYAYVYLGDTKRVPYGNRSEATITQFTREGIDELLRRNCTLILLACNTASAYALPSLQALYKKSHPHVKILGMIEPSLHLLMQTPKARIGLLATQATVDSNAFLSPLKQAFPSLKMFSQAAPLLVPLIEQNAVRFAEPLLKHYLTPLQKRGIEVLLLGCTHYPRIKHLVRRTLGPSIRVISQDEILPSFIKNILHTNVDVERSLARTGTRLLLVTDITPFYQTLAKRWFPQGTRLERVEIE